MNFRTVSIFSGVELFSILKKPLNRVSISLFQFFFFVLFTSIYFFSTQTSAYDRSYCHTYFINPQQFPILKTKRFSHIFTRSKAYDFSEDSNFLGGTARVSDHPTLIYAEVPVALRVPGDRYQIQRKKGEPWFSDYTLPKLDAGQGDPRLPFKVFGPSLAAVLGFRVLDSETLVFPTVERMNWGVDLLNSWLIQEGKIPVPYRFYAQKKISEATNDPGYIQKSTDYWIPISEAPLQLEKNTLSQKQFELPTHDLVYHSLKISEHPLLTRRSHLVIELLARSLNYSVSKKADPHFTGMTESEVSAFNTLLKKRRKKTEILMDVSAATTSIFYFAQEQGATHPLAMSLLGVGDFANVLKQNSPKIEIGSDYYIYWDIDSVYHIDRSEQAWQRKQYFLITNMEGANMSQEDALRYNLWRRLELSRVARRHLEKNTTP